MGLTKAEKKILKDFGNNPNYRIDVDSKNKIVAIPIAHFVYGKSASRVPDHYRKFPEEFQRQYDMLLMDGKSCEDCRHCNRCVTMFGSKATDTSCQFYPPRTDYN
jgi:hypothetical protein